MNTPRITRAQAAEHFATNVAGQHPPRAKAILDDIWGGKPQPSEPAEEVVVPMGQRVGFTDLMTMDLDIDWKTAVAPAPAMPLPGNRKARRAQKAGAATQAADGSRTITGKAYFRSEDGEWQELNGGKETTVTWRPA
ncbi:hypothetical protein [Ruixingdingia sedimenti]|uniref:Uncharacterized protein n=1 Tax=Ruixingdingia sedimenti TaxID=3073604 RepID=A0ABU1FEB6_9RHOB|nr:hypothetical protein [Xinfangfangia sp. LG-4]MDR5654898.1 hypothetical protein [Xinfangfangia sp. LG-4]